MELWISFLFFYFPLLVIAQSNCPLPTVDDIKRELNPLLLDADSGGGPYNPTVSSYLYTCLAQASTKDRYRRVSIIATFTPKSGQSSQTQHFQLTCSSGTWSARTDDGFETPPSNPMLRRDCFTCVPENLGADLNHCSECSATCRNMGQGSCVSSATDCCPYFGLDNMCTTSCPTNYIANVDTNFTCVCNYTCGPGEVANATCNGCDLTDICQRDIACQNGGSCILLSAPDNYTCDCSGTGYTGENCSVNINDCNPNPCDNNGTCVDGIAGYNCICSNGYTGENCSIDINECDPNPCENGATCVDGVASYTCNCSIGYAGKNCNICDNGYHLSNATICEKDDCSTHCPGTDYQSSMCKFYCQLEVWRQQATTCGLSLPEIVPQDPTLSKEEQWRAALIEQEKFRVIWVEEAKQRGLTFPSDTQKPIFDSVIDEWYNNIQNVINDQTVWQQHAKILNPSITVENFSNINLETDPTQDDLISTFNDYIDKWSSDLSTYDTEFGDTCQ